MSTSIPETLELPFYNTVELRGPKLAEARTKARSQEEEILAYFRLREAHYYATPEDLIPCMAPNTPITSIRRALTNLTKAGLLEKIPLAERFTMGRLGKPVHSWRLRTLARCSPSSTPPEPSSSISG